MTPDLAAVHAAFVRLQDRGDVCLPIDPADIDPPETAPVYLAALVAMHGDAGDHSDVSLLYAAERGLELGVTDHPGWEKAIARVLRALERERQSALQGVRL
jgi:hypothetical protein